MIVKTMDRKWDIFMKSADLFSVKGYHNVSMREIAEAVNIKPSSIYNHFASKHDILQAIFDYYEDNRYNSLPDATALLALVGTEPALDTLHRTIAVYPEETREIMGKALRIADLLSAENAQAARIIDGVIFTAGVHTKPLLERMLELELIEPMDVDGFCNLFNSFCHSAAVRHSSDRAFTTPEYIDGLTTLFQLVKPRMQ